MNEPRRTDVESSDQPKAGHLPHSPSLALMADEFARAENDRQLIGYDIHDGVVQGMVASIMQLEAMLPHLPEPQREKTTRVVEMLRGSVAEARRIIQGLGPAHLEEAGLIAAIEGLIAQQGADRCPLRFRHEINPNRIPLPLQSAIYRIVQEGISNINRHSQASAAEISLLQSNDRLRLTVADNGVGLGAQEKSSGGFGLRGITQRAHQFGVRPSITSVPGAGTTIEVEFPLLPFEHGTALAPD